MESKQDANASEGNFEIAVSTEISLNAKESVLREFNQLTVIPKAEAKASRPTIPATVLETLAYYRSYISSPSKTQIICMQHIKFNNFLWNCIMNTFCKSAPNTYIYMFLSSYAPDQHLFVSKMFPLGYGCNWAFILAGLFNLVTYTDLIVYILDYVVCGVIYNSPWNRCQFNVTIQNNVTITCYNLTQYIWKQHTNITGVVQGVYVTNNSVLFQMAPIAYYIQRRDHLQNSYGHFALLWIVAALSYGQIFKKNIWKILNNIQYAINFVYVICFGHLFITSFDITYKSDYVPSTLITDVLWIDPARDSLLVVLSNAFYYLFCGLMGSRLKIHCENIVKAPITLSEFNPSPFLYLWPIYFSTIYFGDVLMILFFTLILILEMAVITITFQCLLEVIVCEWKWANRATVTISLCISGILLNMYTYMTTRIFLFVFSSAIATLIEVLIVYWAYPFGRLLDDIMFHYGTPVTRFRVISFHVVPLFYLYKMHSLFKGLLVAIELKLQSKVPHYMEMLYAMCLPYILGAVYITILCICVQKREFGSLLKPIPEWGPTDPSLRKLRKQFDSVIYVESQAPRELSRYINEKSELESYKLDIPYDVLPSTSPKTDLHKEDEKKKK